MPVVQLDDGHGKTDRPPVLRGFDSEIDGLSKPAVRTHVRDVSVTEAERVIS
ncbi:MAG: hypothetical protein AAGF92_09960 [Myxococcota bacterium]